MKRVLMMVLALVAVPLAVSVAQGHGRHVKHGRNESDAGARRSAQRSSDVSDQRSADADASDCQQDGQHEGEGCVGNPPPPPPPPPPPSASASISGVTYFDANGNSVRDPGETGIAGWVILLTGPVNVSTTTDALGNYSFTGLASGTYTVCPAGKFGAFPTAPLSGPTCPFGFGYTVSVLAGQALTGYDFGSM